MEKIFYPEKETWETLCIRPSLGMSNLDVPVRTIMGRVKTEGDKAIRDYTNQFDKVDLNELKVSKAEIDESAGLIPEKMKSAIDIAAKNIEKFHKSQAVPEKVVDTMPGVRCWRKNIPVEKVGLYIPGGSAPLFSTALMLSIPAKIAGCNRDCHVHSSG